MRRSAPEEPLLLDPLLATGDDAPGREEKCAWLARARSIPEQALRVDMMLLDLIERQQTGLLDSRKLIGKLEEVHQQLTCPPFFPATFLGSASCKGESLAVVQHGTVQRIVGVTEGVDLPALTVGDVVYLGHEMNAIMGRAPAGIGLRQGGEICQFERRTAKDQLVIKSRDQEFVADAAATLRDVTLKAGDLLSWDSTLRIAYEKHERSTGGHYFLENTPTERFEHIGGLSAQIARIKESVLLHLQHGNLARKYQLRQKGSLLLYGPSGTGKTMLARAFAHWLAGQSAGGRSRFMHIKPSSLHSVWYSQSEANYREVFRVAREAADAEPGTPVVMFFDEVDSIGTARGHSMMRVHDNVLTAFMTELDGLESRKGILVVGATNRRESLDPALLRPGRFGDMQLEVPRPGLQGAREIFARHLPADIPYARNGCGDDAAATRQAIIESIVSRIYAPNAACDLAQITFRDGKRRAVRAPDLINGAIIANIARNAAEHACLRELAGGDSGVLLDDVDSAAIMEFETAARALTPANCRAHLSGLPHDLDVVNVELVLRKVSRPQKYLSAA